MNNPGHNVYRESDRDIPICADVDVLVVGAGPAGMGAAIAAARAGAKTLLIDMNGMLGGTWTKGLQNHVTSFHNGNDVVIRGLPMEIFKRLHKIGWAEDPEKKHVGKNRPAWWSAFDPEGLKYILDCMTVEAGVDLLLHTFCVGAIVEKNRVKGVIIENKSGRQAITARSTVDCTGDADVAYLAGAETLKGRAEDGLMQPVTTTFFMAYVDIDRAIAHCEKNPGRHKEYTKEAKARGELNVPREIINIGAPTVFPGITYHNVTRIIKVDATNARDLTRAELEGRRQVQEIVAFYRKYVPGFEKSVLVTTSPSVGIRETRRIKGEYTLTREDVLESREFHDAVVCHAYYIDVHNPAGPGLEHGSGPDVRPPRGSYYQIPYRTLVPQKVDGLLVAGRCISADRHALGSLRVTACCMALGQAAGIAAAMCKNQEGALRRLNVAGLRKELLKASVFLGEESEGNTS